MSKNILEKISSFNKSVVDNSELNCIVENLSSPALENLKTFTDSQKSGSLYGNTIGIKDNINIKGVRMSCGSQILNNYSAPYSATAVERLESDGGLIVCTTNMDEFAMGSSTEYSIHGPTKNIFGDDIVAGGSSGGSAVAVASDLVDVALGSDTGGSVRQPASFCGIYGLKPTYGRVSRYGLTAFASSFDQIGIFSKSIQDMVNVYQSISGFDLNDSTSSNEPIDSFSYDDSDAQKLKIGLPFEIEKQKNINHEVIDCYLNSIDFFKNKGFEIVEFDMNSLKYAVSVYYVLSTAEAASNLSRFDGIRYGFSNRKEDFDSIYFDTKTEGFGEEVKRRIIIGTYVLSSGYYDQFYSKAQKVRKIIKDELDSCFKEIDLLFLPTSPELPYAINEKKGDPLSMYLGDSFTVPMNLSGIPAINVPLGYSKTGLPIGMQFASNRFNEDKLFSICSFLESHNRVTI